MRHKFYPRKNPWSVHGGRMTIQRAYRNWVRPYKPLKADSLNEWKYERELASFSNNKGRHRSAIGMVRAFGSMTFFNGAYRNAEND